MDGSRSTTNSARLLWELTRSATPIAVPNSQASIVSCALLKVETLRTIQKQISDTITTPALAGIATKK